MIKSGIINIVHNIAVPATQAGVERNEMGVMTKNPKRVKREFSPNAELQEMWNEQFNPNYKISKLEDQNSSDNKSLSTMVLAGAFHTYRKSYFWERAGVTVDGRGYVEMIRSGKMGNLPTYSNDYLATHAYSNFVHQIAKKLDEHAHGPATKYASPEQLVDLIQRVVDRFACNIKNQETGKKYVVDRLYTKLPEIIKNKNFLNRVLELMKKMEIFKKKNF